MNHRLIRFLLESARDKFVLKERQIGL